MAFRNQFASRYGIAVERVQLPNIKAASVTFELRVMPYQTDSTIATAPAARVVETLLLDFFRGELELAGGLLALIYSIDGRTRDQTPAPSIAPQLPTQLPSARPSAFSPSPEPASDGYQLR